MKERLSAFVPAVCAVLFFFGCSAQAVIIGLEPFRYTNGPVAGKSGGVFWDWKNTSPTNHTGIASAWSNVAGAPSVVSGGLITSNSSALRTYDGANESDGGINEFNVSKQVYYKVAVTTGATLPDSFGLNSYDFTNERVFFGKRSGQPNFGMESATLATNSTWAVTTNTTYTLVVRLDFNDNLIRLYVNPDLSQSEPAKATVSAGYTDTYWSTSLMLGSGAGAPVTWDNLAVGTSWEDLRTVVTTTADEDDGSIGGGTGVSLREAVRYSYIGSLIVFSPALSGQTINLGSEITLGDSLTIDASSLPQGITLDGGEAARIFFLNTNVETSLRGLTLTGGSGNGTELDTQGGAIANLGTLSLVNCTLANNFAGFGGGAIYNTGGSLSLTNCTLYENATDGFGGALVNDGQGTTTLTHCTLATNQANGIVPGFDGGGAVDHHDGTTTLNACILAGNTAASGTGPDLWMEDTNVAATNCLIGDGTDSGVTNGVDGNLVGTSGSPIDALLAPAGNYGGSTETMPPLPGSPAIDAVAGSVVFSDQRGLLRPSGGAADIGAVEVQNGIFNTIYDSLGFEPPRFSLAALEGQDGVNGPWVKQGAGTATIQTNNVAVGSQAVRLVRSGADVQFTVVETNANVGKSATPIIAVEWSMSYQAAGLPPGSFGPYFGIGVHDGSGGSPLLAASAGVDATTATLLFQSPGTGTITAVPGITVLPNTWHNYRLELNYAAQTYRLIYDGTEVLTNSFVGAGIANFTDADIMGIAAAGDIASQNASGTAFFDNYKVTAQSKASEILAIQPSNGGQVVLSWTPATPGGILMETPSLDAPAWTLSPSVSANPVTVSATTNKFFRLYKP